MNKKITNNSSICSKNFRNHIVIMGNNKSIHKIGYHQKKVEEAYNNIRMNNQMMVIKNLLNLIRILHKMMQAK